jgi:hypothetical protein
MRDIKIEWENNIKIDLKGMGYNTSIMDEMYVNQDRGGWRAVVNTAMGI